MNERIKELAEQTELAELYDRYVEYCMKNTDDDIMDYDTIVKKFAELIVRDVLDEVLQAMDDGMDVYDTVADKFGVEE